MTYTALMNSLAVDVSGVGAMTITDDWTQGRTTYGGLSAAICLKAILDTTPSLPPLRSAQISFIGPVGGNVSVASRVLRQGRSVTFAEADLSGEKGLATRGTFCFGANRESIFDRAFIGKPDVPGPENLENFFRDGKGPNFSQHYDARLAKGGMPISKSPEHDHFLWVRHKDESANDMTALLALADMPPPAMLPMFPHPAPISSMTWMLNFLNEAPTTDAGWWLLQCRAENAGNGYSSQDMIIWNRALEPVVAGRQSVALFI